MQEKATNPIIVKRAAEIWKRAMAAPIYNNLGPGEVHVPSMFVNALMSTAPKNNTPEILEKFAAELEKRLLAPVTSRSGDWTYFQNSLCVDYHPDPMLKESADAAGLKMDFPIKTSMYMQDDCVGFAMGYGKPMQYHYPLSGGRWVITDLRGDDMQIIIGLIERGIDVGLTVE